MFLQLKVTYSFLYSNVYPMDKRAVEWLFDLFDDSNNLEELRLVCLPYAMNSGTHLGGLEEIGQKFKKLKKCYISLHAEDDYGVLKDNYKTCKEYVKAFSTSLYKNFNDRPTEFNVVIRNSDPNFDSESDFNSGSDFEGEKKLYQITKMPFESSVEYKKLKWFKCDEPHNCSPPGFYGCDGSWNKLRQ